MHACTFVCGCVFSFVYDALYLINGIAALVVALVVVVVIDGAAKCADVVTFLTYSRNPNSDCVCHWVGADMVGGTGVAVACPPLPPCACCCAPNAWLNGGP